MSPSNVILSAAKPFAREWFDESKNPYNFDRWLGEKGICLNQQAASGVPLIGVLRLRDCFASRSSHSAQDDSCWVSRSF